MSTPQVTVIPAVPIDELRAQYGRGAGGALRNGLKPGEKNSRQTLELRRAGAIHVHHSGE